MHIYYGTEHLSGVLSDFGLRAIEKSIQCKVCIGAQTIVHFTAQTKYPKTCIHLNKETFLFVQFKYFQSWFQDAGDGSWTIDMRSGEKWKASIAYFFYI